MFSMSQKREISEKVQQILRDTNHPELPTGEISFVLHVDGAEPWSWADIANNGAVQSPSRNPWNEAQAQRKAPTKEQPKRIQRKRTKGWKMPPNTLAVTRPGRLGNPFRIGGWFALDIMGMSYYEAAEGFQDERFTLIETREQSIAMFRQYRSKYKLLPSEIEEIRRADFIACWCPLDQPCHADVLLEIANEK